MILTPEEIELRDKLNTYKQACYNNPGMNLEMKACSDAFDSGFEAGAEAVLAKLVPDDEMVEMVAKFLEGDKSCCPPVIDANNCIVGKGCHNCCKLSATQLLSQLSAHYEAEKIKAVEEAQKGTIDDIAKYLDKIGVCPLGVCSKDKSAISYKDCWIEALKGGEHE
jgi:hypothetical protein